MLILFLVVLGVFSFVDLGVDLFPRTDPATVNVRVRLPGASPEEVTSQVILPLEESIAAISGIEDMRSMVTEGSGNIIVTFVLERNIGEAAEDVREKVSQAMRKLPPNVLPPTVAKSDPDSDPVITMAVSGNRAVRELTEIADKQIRRALETVDGVGGVDISGGRNRQINIYMDLDKLNAYNLSAQEVERRDPDGKHRNARRPRGARADRDGRSNTGPGRKSRGVRQHHRQERRRSADPDSRHRPCGRRHGGEAHIRILQGKPAVMLDVRRQIGTNIVKVVDEITAKLEKINKTLPPGVRIDVVKEQATFIKASVSALEEHLLLGSLLASFIVWIFIRDWRMVLISSIAIPTSIVTTFTFMRLMDFTLNSMTLLGLTLAVGIVIDDAIIVMENIYRFIEEKGLPARRRRFRPPRRLRWRLSRPLSHWSSSSYRSRSCRDMPSGS